MATLSDRNLMPFDT